MLATVAGSVLLLVAGNCCIHVHMCEYWLINARPV